MSDTTGRNDVLLSEDDPFVKALYATHPPVIDEEYGGMPGIPVGTTDHSGVVAPGDTLLFTEQGSEPVQEIEVSKLDDVLGKPASEWAGNVYEYIDPNFVSNMDFGIFNHYYPFTTDMQLQISMTRDNGPEDFPVEWNLHGEKKHNYIKVCAALHNFFTSVNPGVSAMGCVMTYNGYQGDTEVTYIRFERDHVEPITYVLRADSFEFFIDMWYDGLTNPIRRRTAGDWCREDNNSPGMIARGNKKMITQLSREWPLSWIRPIEPTHKWDDMLNGDFQRTDEVIAAFNSRFDRYIAIATKQAERIAPRVAVRDHALMLVFKGNEDLTRLVIGLDRVPGRLPDNGEYSLGERPIDLAEWSHLGNDVLVAVRKLTKVSQWVDQLIEESYKALPKCAYSKQEMDRVVKTRLLASSHFMKELYQISPRDVQGYVEKVANDVMTALHEHGGNIGLDLNSWRVYEYPEDGSPAIPLVKDELNFRKKVFDVHTDRMVEIIYAYMFGIKSPYLRPYANRVVADLKDGIPIGSIRQVKASDIPAPVADIEPAGKDVSDV